VAGRGEGEDATKLSEGERAGVRGQALAWWRKDLEGWVRLLDKDPDKACRTVAKKMPHWQRDLDFKDVRGPEALVKLPEAEREEWRKLWAEVAATLARAQKQGQPQDNKAQPSEVGKKD
jgi:hypothetical protein